MVNSPYIVVSNGSTNSATLTTTTTVTIPAGNPIRITEISLLPDNAFLSYGTFNLYFNGVTNMTDPVALYNSLSIDLSKFSEVKTHLPDGREVTGCILFPGDTIKVAVKSDGSNTALLSVLVVGEPL